jgi:hypothetical protein
MMRKRRPPPTVTDAGRLDWAAWRLQLAAMRRGLIPCPDDGTRAPPMRKGKRAGIREDRPVLRYKLPRPIKPRSIKIALPRRAEAHLTLGEVAARYRITAQEAARRVHAGKLPWPIEDGRSGRNRRWSRIGLDVFDSWEKSQVKLPRKKFRLTASTARTKHGGCPGKVIPLRA